MKYLIAAILFLTTAASTLAGQVEEMLNPTVRVYNAIGSGSGTAIRVDDVLGTFILTNFHVVKLKQTAPFQVQFYGEEERYDAIIYSYNEEKDMAVLLIRHKHTDIAKLGWSADVQVFDEAICVGASLGMDIAPSKGIITQLDYFQPMKNVLMTRTDCKIERGNSGGGLYVKRDSSWVLVGIPSMVAGTRVFGGMTSVNFLGFAVRIKDILAFLLDSNVIEESEYDYSP